MKLHKGIKTSGNYTIVAGCGRLGANLANTLYNQDGEILIIDKNKEAFRRLAPSFGGITVVGDAMDLDVLQAAQIDKADVVVAVTNNDNANIMVAQIARELFQIERVIASLYDLERECVYHEFGIDTVCPAVLSAKEIGSILVKTGMSKLVPWEEKR